MYDRNLERSMTDLDLCPNLNKWLAALGLALRLLAPSMVESGRMDPPLADTIFEEVR